MTRKVDTGLGKTYPPPLGRGAPVSPAAILVAVVERAARVVLERTEGRAILVTVESMFAVFDFLKMRGLDGL
jgi:hypothetical protein